MIGYFFSFSTRNKFITYDQTMSKILLTSWLLETLNFLRNKIKQSCKYWLDSIEGTFSAPIPSLRMFLYHWSDHDVSMWPLLYDNSWWSKSRDVCLEWLIMSLEWLIMSTTCNLPCGLGHISEPPSTVSVFLT